MKKLILLLLFSCKQKVYTHTATQIKCQDLRISFLSGYSYLTNCDGVEEIIEPKDVVVTYE